MQWKRENKKRKESAMTWELRREAALREEEQLALRRRELEFARDLRNVASRPEGKRLLRRLLEEADVFNPSWAGGEEGAYQAGKRAQGLALWRTARRALPPEICLELLLPRDGDPGAADAEPETRQQGETHA